MSGQVLGALLRAIGQSAGDLESELPVTDRQARSYFAGGRISPETRGEVIRLVIRRAMAHLTGGSSEPVGSLGEVEAGIVDVLELWADKWDHLVTHWRVIQPGGDAGRAVARAALRLVVVDATIRAAGVALLTDTRPPRKLPPWARWAVEDSGAPGLLGDLKARADLSITELADMVDYRKLSESAIKAHLAGTHRPGEEQVQLLAQALAAKLGEPPEAVALNLRRHYAIHALLRLVAEEIGWDLIGEAASFAVTALDAMALAQPGQAARVLGGSLLGDGAWSQTPGLWIGHLMKAAPDERWREAILGATRDWFGLLRYEVTRVQRLGEEPFDVFSQPGSAKAWSVAGHFQIAQLNQRAGIACFRTALELDETLPEAHLDLADFLPDEQPTPGAMRRACEEARDHTQRALELRPGWPAAHITMALLIQDLEGDAAADRYLEALDTSVMDDEDAGIIAYDRAAMRYFQERPRPALAILRRLLKAQPTHSAALELAAQCCASLGSHAEAQRYAERAAAVGVDARLAKHRT